LFDTTAQSTVSARIRLAGTTVQIPAYQGKVHAGWSTPPERCVRLPIAILCIAACTRGDVRQQVDSSGPGPVAVATIDSGAPKLLPRDEANQSFHEFRTRLLAALARRDTAFLYGILAPEIKNSFGGDGGIGGFKRQWEMDNPATPVWSVLARLLAMGGEQSADTVFVAPYVFAFWPDSIDAFEHVVVTEASARVLAEPLGDARVLGAVSHSILRVREWKNLSTVPDDSTWAHITLPGGIAGWIRGTDVYSPVGWRAMFVRHGERWTMVYFVAGD
jgi:hypothetical protein